LTNLQVEKLTVIFHLRKIQMPIKEATTTAAIMTPIVKAIALLLVSSLCSGSVVGSTSPSLEALVTVGSICVDLRVAVVVEEEVEVIATAGSVGSDTGSAVVSPGASAVAVVASGSSVVVAASSLGEGMEVASSSCPLSPLSSSPGAGVGSCSSAEAVGEGSGSDPESVGSAIEDGEGSMTTEF
jgi:hypothetical protein